MNNVVTTLAPSFLIGSSSFLQATRKSIISRMGSQGLFLIDFIAVIGLYSQCQIVSFIPNFQRKIPNFKSEKMVCFIMVNVGLTLFVQHVEYSTLHSLLIYIIQW